MANKKKKTQAKNTDLRAPIVTILGHVDHGKTTILDNIRKADVQSGEVGGITQKTSVFTVKHGEVDGGAKEGEITFIDTPGHEAFDLMRTRGGNIADIVLLIVAADDGLKPQTVESIEVIKASSAHPIVVINKIDLPNTNLEKIKRDLATKEILVEGYGGSIPIVEVSGKTGDGIANLLDTINLVIEVEGLVEREALESNVLGSAFVLESVKDKTRGFTSSIVVNRGVFSKGDWIVYVNGKDLEAERIKGFISETNENIEKLENGHGGKIISLSNIIDLGAEVFAIKKKDKKVLATLKGILIEEEVKEDKPFVKNKQPKVYMNRDEPKVEEPAPDWFNEMFAEEESDDKEEEGGTLNVILKSSSEGSLEALVKSFDNIEVDGYTVNLIDVGVGEITMKDVDMAAITKSILLGFEVSFDNNTKKLAEEKRILLRSYDLIYKLTEEVTDALTIMATPAESEEELGVATIKAIFTLTNGDVVLGGMVDSGMMKLGAKCYVVRNDEIVGEGRVSSLKNQKSEIKEAPKGTEFGAMLDSKVKAEEGDEIHCFKVVK